MEKDKEQDGCFGFGDPRGQRFTGDLGDGMVGGFFLRFRTLLFSGLEVDVD